MKKQTWLMCAVFTGLGATSVLAQQPPADPPRTGQQKPQENMKQGPLCKADQLIGLEIKGTDDKEVAQVRDLIFDASDGNLERVVVERGGVLGVGESARSIPVADIQMTCELRDGKAHPQARTRMSAQQIEAAPVFDAEKFRAERAVARTGATGSVREASTANQLVCIKELKGATLTGAGGKELGQIDAVVLDQDGKQISCVVLASGGILGLGEKHFPLPWSEIDITRNEKGELKATSDLTKERLENAPTCDKGDDKRMCSPEMVKEIRAHYSGTANRSRETGDDLKKQ